MFWRGEAGFGGLGVHGRALNQVRREEESRAASVLRQKVIVIVHDENTE